MKKIIFCTLSFSILALALITPSFVSASPLYISGTCVDDDFRITKNGVVVYDGNAINSCGSPVNVTINNAECSDTIKVEMKDNLQVLVGFGGLEITYGNYTRDVLGWYYLGNHVFAPVKMDSNYPQIRYYDTDVNGQTLQELGLCPPIPNLTVSCSAVPDHIVTGQITTFASLVSGGTGTNSYSWSGNCTGSDPTCFNSFSSPGTKTATVVVTSGNQTATASCSVDVVNPTNLSVTCSANPSSVQIGQSTTFTAVVSGATASYNYSWNGACSGLNQSCSIAFYSSGTKTVTVTVVSGNQTASANCSVIVSPPPVVSCSANPSSVQTGQSTTFTASISGGAGTYGYSWSGACTGSSQNCSNTFSTSGTKIATVIVTPVGQTNSYCASCSVNVTQPANLVVSCSASPNPVFTGQLVTFASSASGGTGSYTYSWSGSCTGSSSSCSNTFSTSGTKTGTVTVISGNQTASANCSVLVNPSFSVICSANPSVAQIGQSVTFTASPSGGNGTYTYSWSGACTGSSSNCSRTFSSSGVKTATAYVTSGGQTVASGCSVNVTGPVISCSANPSSILTGQSTTFTASVSGITSQYTYSWSGACTGHNQSCSNTFSTIGTKTATITITPTGQTAPISAYCASCSANVTQAANLAISCSALPNPANIGQSVTFASSASGGTGSYTYSWSGSCTGSSSSCSNTFSTSGTKTGTVTVTSGNQTASANCSTFINPTLAVSCSANPSSIETGQSVTFTANPSGGNGTYIYSWSGACTGSVRTCSNSFSTSGTKTATITVTSGGQTASSSCSVNVTQVANLAVSCSASPNPANIGQSVTFASSASGGTGSYTYSWSGSCTGSSSSCSNTFSTSGTKTGTVTVTSGNQTASANCSTFINPTLAVSCSANPSSIETGQSVTFTASPSGGNGTYVYSWSGACTGSTQTCYMTFSSLGTKTATITVTSGGQTASSSCSANVTQSVTNHDYKLCYNNDVYWYDSNNTRNDIFQDCGDDTLTNIYQCSGSWLQRQRAINTCSNAACQTNNVWVDQQDCGSDVWTGNFQCSGNWLQRQRTTNSCSIAGCQSDNTWTNYQDCGSSGQTCQNNQCYSTPAIYVSCSTSPSYILTGQSTTFIASVFGGTGTYSYSWSGACTGSSLTCYNTISSLGTQIATITVTSGTQTASANCSVYVSQSVTNHDHKSCYNNDVYWYDSSGNRNDIFQDCGDDVLTSTYQCSGSWLQRQRTTNTCSNATCQTSNIWTNYQDCGSSGQTCQNNQCSSSSSISVYCSANPSSIQTGQSTTFIAFVSGGSNYYNYSWSGACSGSSQSCYNTFPYSGTQTATINVTSGGQTASASCSVNVANTCECTSGPCCDGCHYKNSYSICNTETQNEYGCPWGPSCGGDVGIRTQTRSQYCTGYSASCTGNWSGWTGFSGWSVAAYCSTGQVCSTGISTCQAVSSCTSQREKRCYDSDVYWYDLTTGYRGSKYRDCQDDNECTIDSCTGSACVNELKCDGTTCAKGSASYCSSCNTCGDGVCGCSETIQSCSSDCGIIGLAITLFGKRDADPLQWLKTFAADPDQTVDFLAVISNGQSVTMDNVMVTINLPQEITYKGDLTLDGNSYSGDIRTGISLGSLLPKMTKTVTFKGQINQNNTILRSNADVIGIVSTSSGTSQDIVNISFQTTAQSAAVLGGGEGFLAGLLNFDLNKPIYILLLIILGIIVLMAISKVVRRLKEK